MWRPDVWPVFSYTLKRGTYRDSPPKLIQILLVHKKKKSTPLITSFLCSSGITTLLQRTFLSSFNLQRIPFLLYFTLILVSKLVPLKYQGKSGLFVHFNIKTTLKNMQKFLKGIYFLHTFIVLLITYKGTSKIWSIFSIWKFLAMWQEQLAIGLFSLTFLKILLSFNLSKIVQSTFETYLAIVSKV